ncbi:unnamed protein product [Rotaria magnacalcarata]|uniref:Biogenesis of lysosome-related organelles complex 1 subunit 7 n=1 Tax=Rotaria magnacalcarata TaxID=392030 RepID=A0A819CP91_9BILA|nr:unnamed protein product [Rotaria magnacalcarata]CAF1665582.1 unnamed protein product [Rotaria magnacalcarata]CAF2033292.1 unnamed protein product [Rotaria magnacalcarata]CAF2036281.1 unnamed protein product [Rotaria magnacalcarata]CAF2100273.1 unnamed protein product [Rotaria magnacalcarata]
MSTIPNDFVDFIVPVIQEFDEAVEQVRHRQNALGNCLTAINDELATLYKQCPGDREIEEYIKRIHALRQRLIEGTIHVKIIEDRIGKMEVSLAKTRT